MIIMGESNRLVIFGNTGAAKIAFHYFTTDSKYDVVAFTVDSQYIDEPTFQGLPVVAFEDISKIYSPDDTWLFVAMGYSKMNKIREEKYMLCRDLGYRLASYVSSKCNFLSENQPGDNCMILEDNTVQPYVEIGDNVVLWSGNHIGHDVVIGSHSFISSHVVISGNTVIGERCFLGVNSTVRDSIELGDSTLVGAGAIIMSSTEQDSVWLPPKSTKIRKKSSDLL